MRRVISLWLPDWPIDLLRRRMTTGASDPGHPDHRAVATAPIILWSARGGAQMVVACCRRCRARGVVAGMRMAHARVLLTADEAKACVLEKWRPRTATLAMERLAQWALRYAPTVGVDRTTDGQTTDDDATRWGLLIDLDGCGRLHGETVAATMRLLRRIETDFRRLGVTVRSAAAPSIGAAWALARYAPTAPVVVTEGELVAALDPLPITALRLDPQVAAALREVEVTRLGDLRILPREAIARRHGGAVLRRLDQAFADDIETSREVVVAVRETPRHRVRQPFDGPVRDVEAIALATRATIDRLCSTLESAAVGVRRLALVLERAGAEPWRHAVDLSRPTRRATHLWALLRPHLDRAPLAFGVEAIVLEALRTTSVTEVQRSRWSDGHRDDDSGRSAGELLDALLARLGAERVLRPTAQEAHLPERRVALRSVLEENGRGAAPESGGDGADRALAAPPVLLPQPEPATVEPGAHPEAPPAWLSWRGERLVIAVASGPQRLLGPWWERSDAAARDYWRLRGTCGRWLWAYRDLGSGRWFVHGVWS